VSYPGGVAWLREKGVDVVDMRSKECLELIEKFRVERPDLWKECIGEA